MRKVFLDELPKVESVNQKGYIKWKESIGVIIKFIYDDIIGEFEILDYDSKKQILTLKYKDIIKTIKTNSLLNCGIGRLIGKISKNYKYNLGHVFKNKSRNITIIGREIRQRKTKNENVKYYNYLCNTCGWTGGWIEESNLKKGTGCSCCSGDTVVNGINDIPTTAPWMIPYFQGGYDEAKLYTRSSNKKINPICPECGDIGKLIKIGTVYNSRNIFCNCSDSISYPEKFIMMLLKQLDDNFIYQLTKKDYSWCSKYKYDFAMLKSSCIIETHGEQHYKKNNNFKQSLDEIQENDKIKENLAKANEIKHYIILDCRKSELEWIKKSVMESELPKLLNFTENDIDWIKCGEYAITNLVKEVCKYKYDNDKTNINEMATFFHLNSGTIRQYLKQGSVLWDWIDYYKDKEKNMQKVWEGNCKKVAVYNKKGILVCVYNSTVELSRESLARFGVYLCKTSVHEVCYGNKESYKGYSFKFI